MTYEYEFEWTDEATETPYIVQVELTCVIEPNYGADADGNRGEPAAFVGIAKLQVFDYANIEIKDNALINKAHEYFYRWEYDKAGEEAIEAKEDPDRIEYN